MLSKTAETKPSPSATCHDASGTSDSRKIEPRIAPGSSSQWGLRNGAHSSSAIHTAAPMNGKRSDHALNLTLTTTLTTIAVTRVAATMKTRTPSILMPAIVPPINAAAMLPRNDDSTKIITSSTNAFPVVGQQTRQPRRDLARFEMLRQQREAQQQPEQVHEQYPLVPEVREEARC